MDNVQNMCMHMSIKTYWIKPKKDLKWWIFNQLSPILSRDTEVRNCNRSGVIKSML